MEIEIVGIVLSCVVIIKIVDFFEHQFEKKKRDKELKEKLAVHAWKPVNVDAVKPIKPVSNLKSVKQVRK